jgi:hypothetical protein
MSKIVIICLICLQSFAAVSEQKLDYLVDLLSLHSNFDKYISKAAEIEMKERKELRLMRTEYLDHLKKHKKWAPNKKILMDFFAKEFSEDEINKLIAIHEIPVIIKLRKKLPTAEALIVKDLTLIKEQNEEDDYRLILKDAQEKYSKLKIIQMLKAKKK